ncbi:IS66 family insertion sequence element accessory protein TnpB [Paraburkholderia sp.]|uniref:IS66 family insertion sequence element accessory protein TnpB n=1 Tax=Paraburkholderia sp. TaxID=1926495 RepID=UPI0032C22A2A
MVPIIFDLMDTTLTESEARPGSRKGRPNHDPEYRRRLAPASCDPSGSIAKLTRENGINANMLFTCQRRYREQLPAGTTSVIPVTVVHEAQPARVEISTGSTERRPSDSTSWNDRGSDWLRRRQGRWRRRRRYATGRTGKFATVISLPTGTRDWLVAGVIDMRCGSQGLAAKVQTTLEENPLGGNVFIFRGRRGDLVKLLWTTEGGLWPLARRLERGRFVWPQADGGRSI